MFSPHRLNNVFSLPIRVYNHDIDAGRVVFVANYLKFMERARSEWLHSLGVSQRYMEREQRAAFVVREAVLQCLRPAFLDDMLDSTVRIAILRRSSLTLHQTILRGDTVLCTADINAVCINVVKFRPVQIPQDVRHCFERDLQTTSGAALLLNRSPYKPRCSHGATG